MSTEVQTLSESLERLLIFYKRLAYKQTVGIGFQDIQRIYYSLLKFQTVLLCFPELLFTFVKATSLEREK